MTELDTTLTLLNFNFDVIGLSETKIIDRFQTENDINMKGYKTYHTTPTPPPPPHSFLKIILKHLILKQYRFLNIFPSSIFSGFVNNFRTITII